MTARIPFSYLLAVAWTALVAATLQQMIRLFVGLRPAIAGDLVSLGAIEALVFVGGSFGVLALHGRDAPLRASLALRPTHPGLLLLGLALGFFAHFPAESVDALYQHFFPTPEAELESRMALLSAETPLRLAAVVLVVACVGPLVEEVFFRGALYGALRRNKPLRGAVIVTAFCFVVGHLDYYLWPALTVVALVMTYLRAVSGSLLPSLAMHVAFNAATEFALVMGQGPVPGPPKLEVGPQALGWAVTLVLLFGVQYLASRAPAARRGRAEDAE